MKKNFNISKSMILKYSFLCLICVFFQILMSAQVNNIVDNAMINSKVNNMIFSFVVAILSIVSYQIIMIFKNRMANKIVKEKIILLKNDLFFSFFKDSIKSKTEYISMFCNDFPILEENYYMAKLNQADMLCIVTMLSFSLIKINWLIFLLIILMTIFNMIFNIFSQNSITKNMTELSNSYDKEITMLENYFEGFTTVKSLNIETLISSLYAKTCLMLENTKFKYQYKINILSNIYEGMSFLNIIIITLFCSYLVTKKILTLGDLINVTILANMFFASVPVLLMSSLSIKSTQNVWNKVHSFNDLSLTIKPQRLKLNSIEIVDLDVTYDETIILKNFNFHIRQGDKICIIGKNGSGKSTLVNCICGLQNYTGTILYNDKNINDIDIFQNTCYISQKTFMFSSTLAFNIFLDKTEEDVDTLYFNELIEILNLKELYNIRGSKSILLDDMKISGGEKQKIALLRILLKGPELLILDEALSMVDTESRNKILNYLLLQNFTIIYITHNLEEVELYDKVIDLDSL